MAVFRKDKMISRYLIEETHFSKKLSIGVLAVPKAARFSTSRVADISFVKNLHLQAQFLCELPVVSVLALQPFTPLGKEQNSYRFL